MLSHSNQQEPISDSKPSAPLLPIPVQRANESSGEDIFALTEAGQLVHIRSGNMSKFQSRKQEEASKAADET